MADLVQVPIAKAKALLDVDLEQMPDEVFKEAVIQGFKSILARGMSKILTAGLEGAELAKAQDDALAVAKENLAKCYSGEIRFMATKRPKKGGKGKENTRVMQKARAILKDQMRDEGLKVSHYSAKEITQAAEQMLADDPEMAETLLAEAREELKQEAGRVAERKEKGIKLASVMKADPERVKKANDKAEKLKAAKASKPPLVLKRKGEAARA